MKEWFQRFFSGWTSDIEASLQPKDTVREANNMRIMAENRNSAGLQNMLGTLESFSLNPNYFPIGWCKIANQIVVLSTKDITGSDQNGEIGVATIDPITFAGTYVPYYNHQDLNFNSIYQIEARGYDENESKRRVYWTDDYNPPRALNLLDARFTTYFNQAAVQAAVGSEFMVLTDSVTNGTNTYGPNQAAGTVLTSDGTEVFAGSPLVIEYVDVTTIDTIPERTQDGIYFSKWLLNGTLLGGGYQFCYQLMTLDGTESTFTYATKAFHVGDPTVPSASTVDYQAFQGSGIAENSGKGIQVTITGIDTSFDQIRVVAIRTIDDNATDVPVIVFEGDITGAAMDIDYFGDENLGTIAVEDLAGVVLPIRRVNTIDILQNRMFYGNVKLADYVPVDTSGYTLTPIEYLYQVDVTGRPDSATDASTAGLSAAFYIQETAPAAVATDQWYEVLTTPVTYNAVVMAVGDTFQGVAGIHVYVGAGTIRAVTKIQRYTNVYKLLPVKDDWGDTKNGGFAAEVKSHHRQEVYRYAMLVHDSYGNPQFGHWIADWECPAVYDTTDPNTGAPLAFNPRLGDEYVDDYGAGLHSLSARSIGINFSNIDFNPIATALGVTVADLPQYMSGFSIVRAKCDKQIIGQGILKPSTLTGIDVHPLGPPYITADLFFTGVNRKTNVYFWHSPEFLFDPSLAVTVDGDKLEVIDYIEDTHKVAAFAGGTLEANNYHFYEKDYESIATPAGFPAKGTQNNVVVANSRIVNPAETVIAIGTTGDVTQNDSGVQGGGIYGVNPRTCVGGFSYLMYTETNEGAVPWSTYASTGFSMSLVNLVRPKSSLYGGNSDAAKAATQYMYCGHYQPMDAAFMAYLAGNGGVADDIEVFGGDTYVSIFDVARMIREDNSGVFDAISFANFFLVESSFNLALREGRHVARDRSFDQTAPAINTNGLSYSNPPNPENFIYNAGYSYEESQLLFPAVPLNYMPNNHFRHRVYGSNEKVDGELVDNFRNIPVNNFKDVNGVLGDIINLIAKSGRLFYLQQDGVGYLPILEREMIPNALGAPVTVGTGGVLERYDEIATFFGNQHQFGVGITEDSILWYDARRKELCSMNVSGNVFSVSLAEGLRNEFSDIIGDVLTNDNPVRNAGISAAYNQPLKEVIFSFRGVGDPAARAVFPYWPVGFSVGYDNANKQFTGKFDLLPGIMLEFNNMLLAAYTPRFPTIGGNFVYPLGYRLTDGTAVYVCILAFTSPLFGFTNPSSDPTHWLKIMDINEVHVADQGDVSKFFGYVYDNSVSVIVNPQPADNYCFYNMKMQSSANFFDTLAVASSEQSVTETGIQSSENYERRFTDWIWSLPFDSNDVRFTDKYIQITLTKDNKLNGQYHSSKDERVKIVSLTTIYRKDF